MADRRVAEFGFKVDFDEQMRRGLAWQRQSPGTRWLLVQDVALAPVHRCFAKRSTWGMRIGGAGRWCRATRRQASALA